MVVTQVGKLEEAVPYQRKYESRFVTQSSDILWGRPAFTGTRVPVDALFDYLEEGESVATFAEHFGIDQGVVGQFLAELQEKLFR